jgi:hypothetical protein
MMIVKQFNIKRQLFLFLYLMLVLPTAIAQDIVFPDLSGYKRVTDYPVYKPDNLYDFINGAADTYLSYGFENLNIAEYQKGKNTIKLEIYKHKDNTRAFGIYSSERSSSFRFLNIGAQGYKIDGSLNFFKGRYYVKIRTNSKSEKVLQQLETLALKVSDMLPGEPAMPKILSEFPEKGKKLNEETYINESVLGHEYLSGAFKAIYEAGDINFSVFIIDKNSPAEAREMVNAFLKKSGLDEDESGAGKYVFRDGYNGTIFLSWMENRIVIIQGLEKDQTDIANLYTSEILK